VRRTTVALVGCVLTLSAVCFAGVATASSLPKPTGNAKTIAFYRHVVLATGRAPGWTEVQTGYYSLEQSGQTANWWTWLDGAAPAGYHAAADHFTIAASGGKIVWGEDEMVPSGACGGGAACTPIEILSNGVNNLYLRFVRPGASTCWLTAHGSPLPGSVGGSSGYGLYGHFLPMRRVGGTVYVTSTYPLDGRHVTEVDTINYATHLPSAGVSHVAAAAGKPAFSFSWTIHYLKSEPVAPTVRAC
jgi:hypothetical protein